MRPLKCITYFRLASFICYNLTNKKFMKEKAKTKIAILVALIVVIIFFSSTFMSNTKSIQNNNISASSPYGIFNSLENESAFFNISAPEISGRIVKIKSVRLNYSGFIAIRSLNNVVEPIVGVSSYLYRGLNEGVLIVLSKEVANEERLGVGFYQDNGDKIFSADSDKVVLN